MPEVLRKSRHIIYADDKQIYAHARPKRIEQLIDAVSADAAAVANWAARNGLRLNPTKTIAIFLGSLSYTSRIDFETIRRVSINGHPVAHSATIKSLGITIHPCLYWDAHVNSIVSRSHFALRSLRFHRRSMSFATRVQLCASFVLPLMDYAAAVYNALTVVQNLKLQGLQNACVRFVFGFIGWRDHVTPYRLALGWLSIKRRIEYLIALLAINIIRNRSPASLANRFTLTSSRPGLYRSARRRAPLLFYIAPRTSAMNRSFVITASRVLNELPFVIDFTDITCDHRASLYDHFLSLDRAEWTDRCLAEGLVLIPPALERGLLPPPPPPPTERALRTRRNFSFVNYILLCKTFFFSLPNY
uniref:Reverse transcriptase domain-containing protein n=1 Tax=Trichogramma kaykai TaxID=54128 RepID=A0ABD2VYN1_9HYME